LATCATTHLSRTHGDVIQEKEGSERIRRGNEGLV
jgi:hypothetical protein